MFGRIEKKIVKVEVQSITLPVMDAVDEGEKVKVFMEFDKNFQNTEDVSMDWLPKSPDMGAEVQQTLTMTIPFSIKAGKFSDLSCEFSIRKRKKGALGKQSGAGAFKKLAWADFELHKYATKSGPTKLVLPLNWEQEGVTSLGQGAAITMTITVASVLQDDITEPSTAASLMKGARATAPTPAATNARGMEAAKSDLSEGRELLAQRGEKLSQLSEAGAELESDAGDFAKMARQLAGGKKSEPTIKKDHKAAIAARHAKSTPAPTPAPAPAPKPVAVSKVAEKKGAKGKGGKLEVVEESEEEVLSSEGEQGADSDDGQSPGEEDLPDINGDNVLDMDLDAVLGANSSSTAAAARPGKSTGGSGGAVKYEDRYRGISSSSGSVVSDSDNEKDSSHSTKGEFGLHSLGHIGHGIVHHSKRITSTVAKGGNVLLNTGQAIVHTGVAGVNKVTKGGQTVMNHASHAVIDGVRNVVGLTGATDGDGNEEYDEDNAGNRDEMAVAAAALEANYQERVFSEYANIEFPKAEIDSTTTADDLRVLEELEAARLENIVLRQKAIQFQFQIAKVDFFANEIIRLQDEKEKAEAALKEAETEFARVNAKMISKSEEKSSLLQELEVMKSKIALSMADIAKYKEEERDWQSRIELLERSLPRPERRQSQAPGSQQQQQRSPAPTQKPQDDDCIIS